MKALVRTVTPWDFLEVMGSETFCTADTETLVLVFFGLVWFSACRLHDSDTRLSRWLSPARSLVSSVLPSTPLPWSWLWSAPTLWERAHLQV